MKYTIKQLNRYINYPVEDNIMVHIINQEEIKIKTIDLLLKLLKS